MCLGDYTFSIISEQKNSYGKRIGTIKIDLHLYFWKQSDGNENVIIQIDGNINSK